MSTGDEGAAVDPSVVAETGGACGSGVGVLVGGTGVAVGSGVGVSVGTGVGVNVGVCVGSGVGVAVGVGVGV